MDLTLAGNQAFSLAQLTFNSGAETLLADVIGGADLLVSLTGVQAGFATSLDVIL
ncbi:hypothetical protein [Nitrosomonas ureae]|uniref:hypothetical protein n=1 Tax=Nitrosomonas ureae TaxID=44577 RepID=UPI0020D05073|nr:hypothetical protein [Nitrosomonas ureae]